MAKRLTLKKLRKINNTNKRISKRQRRSRKISGGETLVVGDVSLSITERLKQTTDIILRCNKFQDEIENDKKIKTRDKKEKINKFVEKIVIEFKTIMDGYLYTRDITLLDEIDKSQDERFPKLFRLSQAMINIRKNLEFIKFNQDNKNKI